MHPNNINIQKRLSEIDQITQKFQETFGDLTDAQLNIKPNQNTWSIAQNIDHFITINSSYFPILKEVRNVNYKPPFIAKIGFIPKMLGNAMLKSVQPQNKKKIKTFEIWEPHKGKNITHIINTFNLHQDELKQEIKDSENILKSVISSLANKNIVYTVEKAFEILIAHEKRHLQQAKKVNDKILQTTSEI